MSQWTTHNGDFLENQLFETLRNKLHFIIPRITSKFPNVEGKIDFAR